MAKNKFGIDEKVVVLLDGNVEKIEHDGKGIMYKIKSFDSPQCFVYVEESMLRKGE